MAKPQAATKLRYRRVLLKLSGEALAGAKGYGIDLTVLKPIARDIAQAVAAGAQICLVVGAGNIYRGLMAWEGGMDRARGRGQERLLGLGDEGTPFARRFGLLRLGLAQLALVAHGSPRASVPPRSE